MIHHLSIPARNPAHVAAVLGELLGGYSGPFIGPIPGAHVAYAEDELGTGIEVYPEDTLIVPGDRDEMGQAIRGEPVRWSALHALVSVKADRATIERVGAREGWRTHHYWRGPGNMKLFELYEFWVENRIMLELVTPDMVPAYAAIARGAVQRSILQKVAHATG
jgi:hypothetical protein